VWTHLPVEQVAIARKTYQSALEVEEPAPTSFLCQKANRHNEDGEDVVKQKCCCHFNQGARFYRVGFCRVTNALCLVLSGI